MARGTRPNKRRDREHGAAAVEFAIVLPLLVVILFGTIAFGIALSRVEAYISAAREGARYAAVHCAPESTQCTDEMIAGRVADSTGGYPVGGTVSVSRDCATAQPPGQTVTVSWSQPIPIQIPLVGDLSVTVPISGTFRCE